MNTIRELKQQEKYKSMLKRKNKEKKIFKDKNASLQLEKQRLYIALRNKDKEIERLNNIIGEAIEYIEERYNGEVLTHTFDKDNVGELLEILKGNEVEVIYEKDI